MTVAKLLDMLRAAGCAPSVRGHYLELAADPPDELEGYVELLQSGLRAMLTGRRWFGIDANGHGIGPLMDGALAFHQPLPSSAYLLCIESEPDAGWDYVDPRARVVLPDAFADPPRRPR